MGAGANELLISWSYYPRYSGDVPPRRTKKRGEARRALECPPSVLVIISHKYALASLWRTLGAQTHRTPLRRRETASLIHHIRQREIYVPEYLTCNLEEQMNMRATKEPVATAAHEQSQLKRNHQCITNLLGRNRISDREKIGVRSAPPEPSFPERNGIAKAVISHLCSVSVRYVTDRAGSFSCYNQVDRSMALPHR